MDFLESLDQSVLNSVIGRRLPWLDPIVLRVTDLGNMWVLIGVTTFAAVWLTARNRLRSALLLLLALAASYTLDNALKPWIARERPDVGPALIRVPATPSFPSGHALNATTAYVGAALMTGTLIQNPSRRRILVELAFLLALLIGWSRLYLGVHYLTDVLAGWSGGLTLALLARDVADRWERHSATG